MEAGSLLEAAPGPGLKYTAALSIAYGAGVRATTPSRRGAGHAAVSPCGSGLGSTSTAASLAIHILPPFRRSEGSRLRAEGRDGH